MVIAQFGLPNTSVPDATMSLKPKPILRNFKKVFQEPQFYTYALTGAMAFSGLFTYVAASPIIFMKIFEVGPKTYGWIFAFMSLSFIGSSQLNSFLLRKYSSQQLIFGALFCQCSTSIVFLILSLNDWLGMYETIGMLFLFLACLGISNPNTAGLTMAPFTRNAGSASALMGAIQLGLGALASFFVGLFVISSIVPMVAIMVTSTLLAFLILNIGRRNIKRIKS